MCGLAGALSLDGRPVAYGPVRAMTDALVHRGPDEGAVHMLEFPPGGAGLRDGSPFVAGFGHRRLKVLDLTPAAAQPMTDARRRDWLVYNGELYNSAALRAELEGRGTAFRSRSDTEVVLEALRAWGPVALGRFNGMFALAFWDGSGRLLLARDRFGEKPLYYAQASGHLVFASEIQALAHYPGVDLGLDPQALELYLTLGFVPAPWTIYRGVSKLPHASVLEAGPGRPARIDRYYRLEARIDRSSGGLSEEALRQLLVEAVGCRLEADVPLGAFLSGGVDSSAVVACMARRDAAPPRTFAMVVPELPYFDESGRAAATAAFLGSRHREIRVDAERLRAEIPAVLDGLGEPFADSSALAGSLVAREARRDVTVALSGDGGDEVFGGYRLFRALAAHRSLRRLPAPARGALLGALRVLPARQGAGAAGTFHAVRKLLRGLQTDLAGAHAAWMSIGERDDRRAIRPGVPDEDLAASLVLERYRRFGGGLEASLAVEVDLPLPDDMLAKVDRTSMLHGLEVRAPFLDPRLVEAALSLPAAAHFSILSGKRLLRRALRPLLPPAVLSGPKRGFEVPIGEWIAGPLEPLHRDVVTAGTLQDDLGLDPAIAAAWLETHRTRRADRSRLLWALFALCWWSQGPRRAQRRAQLLGARQLRDGSSSEVMVLRRSEG